MTFSTSLSTGPTDVGGGRRCAVWISVFARAPEIVDTAALLPGQERLAGPDVFPEDCVLVVLSPASARLWRDAAAEMPLPPSGPALAAMFLDDACRRHPPLAARLGWHTR
jgi:hypothetical protein